jgi:hypothetical protein
VDGYVVTRPYQTSNVGSNLASIAGALWVAQRLERPLVVDWRGQSQLLDPGVNYFTEFFHAPATLLGVPVLYAPAAEARDYAEGAAGARWADAAEARRIAAGEEPPGAPVLVLQQYHGPDRVHPGPESERFRLLRSFYREVAPGPEVAGAVEGWWPAHLDGAFVVGVNVRTGNGQYFAKGQPYAGRVDISLFEDRERFLRLLERAVRARARRLPRPLRDSFVVFYATDSQWMSELLARLPHAVTRRSVFPPPGSGDMFRFEGPDYTDRDSIVDTLADMFLLARCDALVFNSSMFNQYARILNGHFGGNAVHIQNLYPRHRARNVAGMIRRSLG